MVHPGDSAHASSYKEEQLGLHQQTSKNCHILAATGENGYVNLYNTRLNFPSSSTHKENTEKSRICEWLAHDNAIFDICWIYFLLKLIYTTRVLLDSTSTCNGAKTLSLRLETVDDESKFDTEWKFLSPYIHHNRMLSGLTEQIPLKEDANLLTASGDQSIKMWDPQEQKCLGALIGHTGSVKSISAHPTNHELIVSGSRDGSFALWDLRCSTSSQKEVCVRPIAAITGAHVSGQGKRIRRGKAASMSITSVLHLKDEVSIATAGAVDSIVKLWDTRNLKNPVAQACPSPEAPNEMERRLHGISSLSQDKNGVFLSASCMDSRIYIYNVLQLDKGPAKTFSASRIESFFIKSAMSPDAAHLLSGSSDGNAYIWQVNKPQADPIVVKGHDGEVTAVDWCSSGTGRIATSADDFTVRFWNIKSSCYSIKRSPSSIRRRVMALPSMECRKLFMNDEPANSKQFDCCSSDEASCEINSHNPIIMPEISTPESQKRKLSPSLDIKEIFEQTPEASLCSPSSVLSLPSSLKRKTIRDYFLVPS